MADLPTKRVSSYHLASERNNTPFAIVLDAFEQGTRYHREAMEVRLKVSWAVASLKIAVMLLMVFFIAYQMFTTNVYLNTQIPVGDVSHWAGGGSAVAALSMEQANDEEQGLCLYNAAFDYHYGSPPGEWDYSGARCEPTSLSELAFKAARSMHFVTYEHQRMEVKIPRVGDSCDEECQTVYPEWPPESDYTDSEKEWISLHIGSQVARELRDNFPNMRKAPNVHMMKPTRIGFNGNTCLCYSLQNVIHLGMDKAQIQFTYSYAANEVRGSSKVDMPTSPTGFCVGAGQEEPFQIITPGPSGDGGGIAKVTVEEALKAVGTCLDCQPGKEGDFFPNGLCPEGKACPEPYEMKPVPRVSGIQLSLQTEYYNDKLTMPKGPPYDHIKDKYEPPYAIHMFRKVEDWTSRGSDISVIENTPNRTVTLDKYRYGTLINMQPAAGVISSFDLGTVVTSVCNFTVLMGFPPMLITLVLFYALGKRSTLFRRGQRKVVTIESMYRSFAYSAIIAHQTFKSMAQTDDEFITRDELVSIFSQCLLPHLQDRFPNEDDKFYSSHIEAYVDLMVETFTHEDADHKGEKIKGVSHEEFLKYCTAQEPLEWADVIDKLADPDCDAPPLNKLCQKRKTAKVAPELD
eukprot:gnl/TRDRNA2_/TRDRNA2_39198_c0_seq1.p1 gnl/TRDRNA2_/TRDRNA2_39198_c0~~gnl/TRDRNA2_/TRDRNA2_39198_c0_seq1.p1  ORF type:complete len:631 (-),score=68.89 gnl/TRDRNA2_/TRDRNA2_39198_c0_seq1:30-1922(-)